MLLQKTLITLTSLLILIISQTSLAATDSEQRYQVDLILFAHKNKTKTKGQAVLPLKIPQQALNLNALPQQDPSQQLTALSQRLQQNAHYKLIFATTWQQQDRQSHPIHIIGGEDLSQAKTANLLKQRDLWQFDGLITIHKKRLYNTHLKFLFRDHLGAQNQLVQYNINEYRSLKLDEIHYFDNPRFGILLKISTAPAEENVSEAQT